MKTEDLKSKLGRVYVPDERDKQFQLRIPMKAPNINYKYWWSSGWWGNQGTTSQCVAYSWAHWLAEGPLTQNAKRKGTESAIDTTYLYNEAQKNDSWEGECVDTETECLTKSGWKKYNELNIGDNLYTLNIDTQLAEWKKVDKVNIFENRDIISFYNRNYDIRVTKNHKWVVRNRITKNSYKLIKTSELNTAHEFPVKAIYSNFPKIKTYSDEFVQLIAWVATEGHIRNVSSTERRGNGIVISQKKYKNHLENILIKNEIKNGKVKDGLFICEFSGKISDKVRNIISENKKIDYDFILSLTFSQLELFIDECILGDGSIIESKNRKTRKQFHQNIKNGNILDIFLFACVLANKSIGRSRTNKYLNETLNSEEKVETWSIQTKDATEIRKMNKKEIKNITVWCPTTINGTFLARRKGNIFFTGNSYNGTSVRAGAKILMREGYISSYNWAWDIETIKNTLLTKGPMVVGTVWNYDMFFPNEKGIITATGEQMGGHAYLLDGINVKKKLIRIKNSWGRNWGKNGFAYISFDDMAKLISQYGEACLATEIEK